MYICIHMDINAPRVCRAHQSQKSVRSLETGVKDQHVDAGN